MHVLPVLYPLPTFFSPPCVDFLCNESLKKYENPFLIFGDSDLLPISIPLDLRAVCITNLVPMDILKYCDCLSSGPWVLSSLDYVDLPNATT